MMKLLPRTCVPALFLLSKIYQAMTDLESVDFTLRLLRKYKCSEPAARKLEAITKSMEKTRKEVKRYVHDLIDVLQDINPELARTVEDALRQGDVSVLQRLLRKSRGRK